MSIGTGSNVVRHSELASGQSTDTRPVPPGEALERTDPHRSAPVRADRYEITLETPTPIATERPVSTPPARPTRLAALGAQVFPGFRPADAGSHDRTNAAYLDRERPHIATVAGACRPSRAVATSGRRRPEGRRPIEIVPGLALRGAARPGSALRRWVKEFFRHSDELHWRSPVRHPHLSRQHGGGTIARRWRPATGTLGKPQRWVAARPARARCHGGFLPDQDQRPRADRQLHGRCGADLFTKAGLRGVSDGRFFSNAIIPSERYGCRCQLRGELRVEQRAAAHVRIQYNSVEGDASIQRRRRYAFKRACLVASSASASNAATRATTSSSPETIRCAAWACGAHTAVRRGEPRGGHATNATGTVDQTFGEVDQRPDASWSIRSRYSITVGADNVFDVYPVATSTRAIRRRRRNRNWNRYNGITVRLQRALHLYETLGGL